MEVSILNMNDEIRNEYFISKEVKQLWAVQLDLLSKLEKICQKHDLKYFADGGTLLGAVRHKGFIPWDDDIDVQMYISDFESFCKYAKEELQYPYFLQYWDTEEGFYPWHAKLRRSDTTCYTDWEIEMNPSGNHGIFIDIFPLYNIPDNELKYKIQTIKLKILKYLFICYESDRALTETKAKKNYRRLMGRIVWRFTSLFITTNQLCQKYIKICSEEKGKTKKIGVTSFAPGYKKYTWERAFYEKTIDLPFEDRTIKAPYMYEERLSVQYGNWRDIVKNSSNHSKLHFSGTTPYEMYIKNHELNVLKL